MIYPNIDPVFITLGPVVIHWYGLMYLIGFLGGWWLGRIQARRPGSGWSAAEVDDLVFYIVVGVVAGGRIGYTLFYAWPELIADPVMLLRVWEGGMSFHGGFLGVLLAMWLYGRKYHRRFFDATDFIAPLVTIGLGGGRLGNFINGELWGGPSNLPWAMSVPCEKAYALCERVGTLGDGKLSVPVHPTQLYEFLLEGVVLLAILWFYSASRPPRLAVSGMFLLCYGVFRFAVELVRLPDAHIGYLAFGWLTMGQLLTLPMLVFGAILLHLAYRSRPQREPRQA